MEDCVAKPVAMAEAIVPHPKKPMRRGGGAESLLLAVQAEDADSEELELALGDILLLLLINKDKVDDVDVVEVVAVVKARVQERNSGRSKSVDSTIKEEARVRKTERVGVA
jgi:hypothetical protein